MTDRPIFFYKNRTYVSAGVILYTINPESQNCSFLLQRSSRNSWEYEDFGGKSDKEDKSILDVALRECREELNFEGGITEEFLLTQLNDRRSFEYLVPSCKYVLYMIYVPFEFKTAMDMSVFGTYEKLDQIRRDVLWMSYKQLNELSHNDLHPRFNQNDEFRARLPILLARATMAAAGG